MAIWRYAIGNLARRAPAAPVAVAPAVEDSILPLVNLADDFPDTQGGLDWRSDGVYDVDFDLNLLATSSSRADAPTGWSDLLNLLAGSPGLPADPPDWGSYGGRTGVLRLFRPVVQDIDVMPGEAFKIKIGLYRPTAASGSTGTRVTVTDLWSGKSWDGAAWADGGIVATQTALDAWLDVDEEITADPNRTQRSRYRVVVEPLAATYDATTFGYASLNGTNGAPALVAEADLAAIIGHNIPDDATVALGATSMSPAPPSFYATAAAVYTQTWRLSIDMPIGNRVRPILGEVWIGKVRSLTRSPRMPLGLTEGDPGQLRLEASRGRVEVLSDEGDPAAAIRLGFRVSEDDYLRTRDELARLTHFGAEPMLLIPSVNFEGTRFYHGRLGQEVAYSRITAADAPQAWRTFTLEFKESPLAAP